jgi:nucleotide-binding universal stress UspA family protein
MSAPPDIKRMLVALDPEDWTQTDLESVTRLAAGLTAEIEGLFVESSSLKQASVLSATRFVSSCSQILAQPDKKTMDRAMRARASRARSRLEDAAHRWNASWHFDTAEGELSEQLIARTKVNDLIVMTVSRRSRMNDRRDRRTAFDVAKKSACSVLLVNQRRQADRSIVAVFEGDDNLLDEVARLAKIYNAPVTVIALATGNQDEFGVTAQARLERLGLAAAVRPVQEDEQVLAAIVALRPGLVVASQSGLPARSAKFSELARDTSLLVLR